MTTINEQNAKQIRKPMEVYVRMDLSDKSITMTYSGYSSAKIADGKLDQTDWKMRKLTDLQGDGFPLDSSCTLYNPNTTASASNGKIGIRGNIGETVSVTITGSAVMDSATIMVTGASSVSHDGGTSTISGSTVIVSIEASTTTLTFTPKSADRRVEISDIVPGVMFNVTNENMISCTLSLRSDLSIVNPTLPESEMNLEFYNDEDISEILAAIPEDTPITYRAGYDGDLSPERKFYVSGQVTYKDNVVSVHAVDAVHFLDIEVQPIAMGISVPVTVDALVNYIYYVMRYCIGIRPSGDDGSYFFNSYSGEEKGACIIPGGVTVREIAAFLMNMIRFHEVDSEWLRVSNVARFVFDLVDAGIPTIRTDSEPPTWSINEEECADICRNIEKQVGSVKYRYSTATGWGASIDALEGVSCGSAELVKGVGCSLSIEGYVFSYSIGLPRADLFPGQGYATNKVSPLVPANISGAGYASWPSFGPKSIYAPLNGRSPFNAIATGDLQNGALQDSYSSAYTQFVPWGQSYDTSERFFPWYTMDATWAGLIEKNFISADSQSAQLEIIGYMSSVSIEEDTVTKGVGDQAETSSPIEGRMYFTNSNNTRYVEAFPKLGYTNLLDRSPNTGSFTWKGDPRMQPRDVFTFVKLDGTEIDCTIEQIDLEHVGGGTTAKITYREGIV